MFIIILLLVTLANDQHQMDQEEIEKVLTKYHSQEEVAEWNKRIAEWNQYEQKKAGKNKPGRLSHYLNNAYPYLEQELPLQKEDPYYWPVMINEKESKQLVTDVSRLATEAKKWNVKTNHSFVALVTVDHIIHLWLLHQHGKDHWYAIWLGRY